MNMFKILCVTLNMMFSYGVNALTSDIIVFLSIVFPFLVISVLCFVNGEIIYERKI